MNPSTEDMIVGGVILHEVATRKRKEEMDRKIRRLERQYDRSSSSNSVDDMVVRFTTYAVTIIVLVIVAKILGI